jgi:penicillin G amidase
LRALWLDPKPARGFLRLHGVRSLEEFKREFEQWPLLSQSVVYADAAGTIAWQIVGEAPRRRSGWGSVPLSGSDPTVGWHEEGVPSSKMPSDANPRSGFVATANNKPVADKKSAPYLGIDFLDGYRAGRIVERLEARKDWDVASTMALQMDAQSLPWREVRDIILNLPAETADLQWVIETLSAWDGRVSAGSTAASLFELFVREMARRLAAARAPRAAAWAVGRGFHDLLPVTTFSAGRTSKLLRRLSEQPEGWFERGWQAEMTQALSAALRDLRHRFGPDPERWGWGEIRPLTMEHPLGRVKALAPIFNRGPFPWGGDGNTISQTGGQPGRLAAGTPVVASLRVVVPIGDWEAARYVLPGGQSGNPFSPHYDDLLPLWQRGEGVPIAWSLEAVQQATVERLDLRPLA